MKESRIHEMQEYIKKNQFASIDELCGKFERSVTTIRRDIDQLANMGFVKKIYGGVKWAPRDEIEMVPFQQRTLTNVDEKKIIGKLAASFVEEDDVIFIDSGTTTVQMIPHLEHLNRVSIITNNLNVVLMGANYPNLEVILLGGRLSRSTASFILNRALTHLPFNINKAFMAATGISIEAGVSHSSSGEFDIKKAVIKQCSDRFLLADHSKFGTSALLTYAQLEDFHYIVTDKKPSKEYEAKFAADKVKLIYK